MKFEYRPAIIATPDGGDYLLILRPEIPVTIIGRRDASPIIGLVDTGSDNTILPMSVAEKLGVPVRATAGPPAQVFGGNHVQLFAGEVAFELRSADEFIHWKADVYFHDFPPGEVETAILGHAGFLDYFTATFDGLEGILTLLPNEELPAV